MKINYKKLIISLILPHLAGLIGSFFTVSSIPNWYSTLEKPIFNPPNWIFGPMWLLLYTLMGISVYLIWEKSKKSKFSFFSDFLFVKKTKKHKIRMAVSLFWLHLIFNATWSIMFFGLKSPEIAFVNILLIWAFIIVLFVQFYDIRKLAAYLLIPYFLWVSFASVLNFYIMYLN
jgi:translocator protein